MLFITKAAKFTHEVKSVENPTGIHKKHIPVILITRRMRPQIKNIMFALFTGQIV